MALPESSSRLIDQWRSGEETVADAIYSQYATELCSLAESHIDKRLQPRVEAEDIVQSVFRTFFRRVKDGQFDFNHSGALWRLLVEITLRKVCKQVEYHQAAKRDVQSEASGDEWQSRLISGAPSPVEAAALTDELDRLISELNAQESHILQMCLQGSPTPEIADQVGCSRWTVRRALDRIGHLLKERISPDS